MTRAAATDALLSRGTSEASVAANRLVAARGCTWDQLVEALILGADPRKSS